MSATLNAEKTEILFAFAPNPIMSDQEFAELGEGKLAYIKALTAQEAQESYTLIEELPNDIHVYVLHGADGSPIALTDDMDVAIAQAMGDELEIAAIN